MGDHRFTRLGAGLALAFLALVPTISCTSLRLPAGPPVIPVSQMSTMEKEGIFLSTHSIVGRDAYWDHFDDNLPDIGIVAVWISIHNRRSGTIDFTKCRWTLATAARAYRALNPERLLELYYEGRNIRLRSENTDRKAHLDVHNISLRPGSIQVGLRREGFLFFRLRRAATQDWNQGSTLRARGVRLEDGKSIELVLSLSNGNP